MSTESITFVITDPCTYSTSNPLVAQTYTIYTSGTATYTFAPFAFTSNIAACETYRQVYTYTTSDGAVDKVITGFVSATRTFTFNYLPEIYSFGLDAATTSKAYTISVTNTYIGPAPTTYTQSFDFTLTITFDTRCLTNPTFTFASDFAACTSGTGSESDPCVLTADLGTGTSHVFDGTKVTSTEAGCPPIQLNGERP